MAERTANETEAEVPIVHVAHRGDILLTIGDPVDTKLLVSADVLARTSKVFMALLGPCFREGQQIGTSEIPKEIKLPDDDGESMLHMCKLLHGMLLPASEKFKPVHSHHIFGLSVVVDKYACVEYLHLQSQAILMAWLDHNMSPPMLESCRIAAAAYLLDQPRSFSLATRCLALKTSGPFSSLLDRGPGLRLPPKVFLTVQEKRAGAFHKLLAELPLLGMPQCAQHEDSRHGSWSQNWDEGYLNHLCNAFSIPFWPPAVGTGHFSVQTAIDIIKLIGTAEREFDSCKHTGEKDKVTTAEFKRFADALYDMCHGLCLHCVKEGKEDLVSVCRNAEHGSRRSPEQ